MRKLALLAPVFAFLSFAQFASAQQGDIMFGGGTLMSSSPSSGSANFQQPGEKGGAYLNVSGDIVGFKKRLGFNIETAWRARQANYAGNNETYRPILTDFNALYQPRLSKKVGVDLFAGIGIAHCLVQLFQRMHQLHQQQSLHGRRWRWYPLLRLA